MVDPWDRLMMERDSRLTGDVNKQMVGHFDGVFVNIKVKYSLLSLSIF